MITDVNGKKFPERMCMVCRKHTSKHELLRVVKTKDGKIVVDTDKKVEGRGAYICLSEQCIENAKKRNALAKAFKTNIDIDVYDKLLECIKQIENR